MIKNKTLFTFIILNLTMTLCYGDIISFYSHKSDLKISDSLKESINKYLSRYVGKKDSLKNIKRAENFIKSTFFVDNVKCSYIDTNNKKDLRCNILIKRTIRSINISGLPAALLEKGLRRKLPLQIGQTVSMDKSFDNILKVIGNRVETYLRKNGYYGALVDVQSSFSKDDNGVSIFIHISGGNFAVVNKVKVIGTSPISKKAIRRSYKNMCFSFSKIIESVSIGTLSCYSRGLERAVTTEYEEKLANLGYVQAGLRVSHSWLDPKDKKTPPYCKNSTVPKCIDLKVDIELGVKVTWSIKVNDGFMVNSNLFRQFFGSLFNVDQLSRVLINDYGDEITLDQLVKENELLKKVTFSSARNIDEIEISNSVESITDFLVASGYPNAYVTANVIQKNPDNIDVIFNVYKGKLATVKSVRILPEIYNNFVSIEDIDYLVEPKNITNTGQVSFKKIDEACDLISDKLAQNGFVNPKCIADIEDTDDGIINVTFYIDSDKREVIDEIKIINGYENITEGVLSLLSNCDSLRDSNGIIQNKKCHNSSLIRNKIEDDAMRIVDYYKTHNFLYAGIKTDLIESSDGIKLIFNLYDVRYKNNKLKPLKEQNIKDIIVSGNYNTNTSAIRRLFPKERGYLDPIALKKGLSNLRELNRFSNINHKILAGQENSDDVYFLIDVVERPSLSLDTSISFSTDNLFMLEADLEEANLFSSMLKLNTSLGLGLFWGRQSVLSNRLVWPLIFGRPVRLILQAPVIIYNDFSHRKIPFRRLQSKFSLGVDWKLSTKTILGLKYWLVLNQIHTGPFEKSSFSERLLNLDGLISTFKQTSKSMRGVLRPSISYIDLNNPFDPKFGVDLNLWFEVSMGPSSNSTPFINFATSNRFYTSFGPFTIALQTVLMRSFINPNKNNWDELTGASSMDSLGGDRSIRGYVEGDIGIYALNNDVDGFAGYFLNNINLELRFPITQKGPTGNFSGALFADQGMLLPCAGLTKCGGERSLAEIISKKGFGLSFGASLRYSLPVGNISIDYGLSPLTGSGRIHFQFGQSF